VGGQRGLRRFVEELPVADHGLFEPVFDLYFPHVWLYTAKIGKGIPVGIPCAGRDKGEYKEQSCAGATH